MPEVFFPNLFSDVVSATAFDSPMRDFPFPVVYSGADIFHNAVVVPSNGSIGWKTTGCNFSSIVHKGTSEPKIKAWQSLHEAWVAGSYRVIEDKYYADVISALHLLNSLIGEPVIDALLGELCFCGAEVELFQMKTADMKLEGRTALTDVPGKFAIFINFQSVYNIAQGSHAVRAWNCQKGINMKLDSVITLAGLIFHELNHVWEIMDPTMGTNKDSELRAAMWESFLYYLLYPATSDFLYWGSRGYFYGYLTPIPGATAEEIIERVREAPYRYTSFNFDYPCG